MFQKLKSITSRHLSPLLLLYPHQWWVWMELASMVNDINMDFWIWDSGSNLSKDIYFFSIQSCRLLGDLKWNHTHGWLYWWFTFTANSLSSLALLPLISLQLAPCCEVLYWSQQSVSFCGEHCFKEILPKGSEGTFCDSTWYICHYDFFFFLFFSIRGPMVQNKHSFYWISE